MMMHGITNIKFKVAITAMYPRIRGEMVADSLESVQHILGTNGLDKIHIYETNFFHPCPASLLLPLSEVLFFEAFSH
jgi:hypothetical protein